jgi:4-hydroxybenzoate polyprenyltransferase
MEYIRLIRPINLVIVLITQLSVYHFFIYSYTNFASLDLPLSFLLCITTVIITACGYIINDYYDIEIDKLNKPQKWIVGNILSKRNALNYYSVFFLIGLLVSLFIAWKTNNWALLPLYPAAQLLLYKYAKVYKKKGLVGNIIVAIMTAFVSGLILVAERKFLFTDEGRRSLNFILALAVFSLLLNFCRELVKDIEDIEGDVLQGSTSFPIVHGIEKTKYLVIGSLSICILFLIRIGDLLTDSFGFIYIIPLITLFYLAYRSIINAQQKKDYTDLSKYLKITMLVGLIGILILSKVAH